MIDGFLRPDGTLGIRNLLLVVSLLDLANDAALRIAQLAPGAVAVLTPAGGLALPEEASRLDRLRRRLCCHPNVGGMVVIGPDAEALAALADAATACGRAADTVCLLDHTDSLDVVAAGVRAATELARNLASQPRQPHPENLLRLGLRSSSSSLESARTVNPVVGGLVDELVQQGGFVCFGEAADLAGVPETVASRAASVETAARLRQVLAEAARLLEQGAMAAPDPTPTNRRGGIATLVQKGEGALRRIGSVPIESVVGFGEAMPGPGLHMMDGPGSAAVCLAGLAAVGCVLAVYTVGLTSVTVASPLMPLLKLGPSALHGSRDLDMTVERSADRARQRLAALVHVVAGGAPTASEASDSRQIMLPGLLPPL